MRTKRSVVGLVIALAATSAIATAAELPSEVKKAKHPEAAKRCNIAGSPGVVAANGICVRLSGYVSAGFTGGQIK
jgi:hypothetical protein